MDVCIAGVLIVVLTSIIAIVSVAVCITVDVIWISSTRNCIQPLAACFLPNHSLCHDQPSDHHWLFLQQPHGPKLSSVCVCVCGSNTDHLPAVWCRYCNASWLLPWRLQAGTPWQQQVPQTSSQFLAKLLCKFINSMICMPQFSK